MSASAPRQTGLRNPSTKFIKWKGGKKTGGFFEWYDKNEPDEKKRNKAIDLSKGFYILDKDLFCITGYDEPNKVNIISNEVREINDVLIVNGYKDKKKTLLHKGTYAELKPIVSKSRDMKYTRSIYIMTLDGLLCNIHLYGAAFAQWIKDVESNSNHSNHIIRHTGVGEGEKGEAEWKFPIFEVGGEATKEHWDKVLDLDSNVLQPFLKDYLSKGEKGGSEPEHTEEEFDCKNWRQFKLPSGSKLCELSIEQLREASDAMIGAGDVECPLFDCVSQALLEFRDAFGTWKDKKDKSGKSLADYTLEEISATIKKVPADHPSMIFLLAAKDEKENAVVTDDEDPENIPF